MDKPERGGVSSREQGLQTPGVGVRVWGPGHPKGQMISSDGLFCMDARTQGSLTLNAQAFWEKGMRNI